MARRFHVPNLHVGDIPLDKAQAHHARDVLRLADGTVVEVFDDAGATAKGRLIYHSVGECDVRIQTIDLSPEQSLLRWTVAAAVPKGDRSDWMIEKLSELGATCFIPLAATRSVVLPEGKSKRERWLRIATEAAKQSRRTGVMRIESLTPLTIALNQIRETNSTVAWYLATEVDAAISIGQAISSMPAAQMLTMFVGPEGGWTIGEIDAFTTAKIIPIRLGHSTLRIETAAVAAGAIVSSLL